MTRVGRNVTAAVLVILATVLGACSSGGEPGLQPADQPGTSGPIDASQPIEITVDEDGVTPNGTRLEVERGQTLQFVVTSDRSGEFHVHSTPEQTLTFDEGTTELELTIDRPGVADMELHEPALTVLQLEVR